MHEACSASFHKAPGERLGISLAAVNGQTIIDCVRDGSLACDRLDAGSILLAVNGKRICSPNEAQELIAAASCLELELLRPRTRAVSLDSHDLRKGLKLVADREGLVAVAAVHSVDGGADIECGASSGLRVGDKLCSVGGMLVESPKSVLKQLSATTGWIEVSVLSSDKPAPNLDRHRAPLGAVNANRHG